MDKQTIIEKLRNGWELANRGEAGGSVLPVLPTSKQSPTKLRSL